MEHDFDEQRRLTFWVWNDLASKKRLPKVAKLDLQFIPSSEKADWASFKDQLLANGYAVERYDDNSTLEASIGPLELSAEIIWEHEFKTTQIALTYDFSPDGWGFLSEQPDKNQ